MSASWFDWFGADDIGWVNWVGVGAGRGAVGAGALVVGAGVDVEPADGEGDDCWSWTRMFEP